MNEWSQGSWRFKKFFKIEGGFRFKTKDEAEAWAESKRRGRNSEVYVHWCGVTHSWSAEVHS